MRYLLLPLLFIPFLLYAQEPYILVDSIGNSGRIQFVEPNSNILIGEDVGNPASTASHNIFIGKLNGSHNSIGVNNLAFGFNSLVHNKTGSYNINIGGYTGTLKTKGFSNINIGDSAGYIDSVGNNNVNIGFLAGTNAFGSNNVFLGYSAGYFLHGDNKLAIVNSFNKPPLILGDFLEDTITINGDLVITDSLDATLATESIDISQVHGIFDRSPHVVSFPQEIYNNATIEIANVINSKFIIVDPFGINVDTITTGAACTDASTGANNELDLFIKTDSLSDIAIMDDWFFNNFSNTNISIIINDAAGNEATRYELYDFQPNAKYTDNFGYSYYKIIHILPSNYVTSFEKNGPDFGNSKSYNQVTDKKVEIIGVTNPDFFPAVTVDYVNRTITLDVTYDEGAGLYDWVEDFAKGIINKKTVSVIETINDGETEVSQEDFLDASAFSYELISGSGLDSKLKARIKIFYACNAPG